ncbi:hypothetical protein J2Z76_000298 [Sedimentibacter acidaminivorans]|jgi:hypothetical protein|uniref:Uncharacterized protein n=1 Tax=Sedimentibacter acidaminivorans TaxID=913099 RepID=A0ABS4G9S6_9FIRM|nr:hypothetical protein [Sedimentibacter acidaminivorans]MBP1924445.1 hypothetical protein [Sedimentibacter acidaminivorans]
METGQTLIGKVVSEKTDCIFFKELKECSKIIYDIPKFIYYAIGYAIENILVKTKIGIQSFILLYTTGLLW